MSRKALSLTVVGGLSIIIVLQIISLQGPVAGTTVHADDSALALLDDDKFPLNNQNQDVVEDPRLLAIGALGASHVYTMYGYIGVMADGYVGVDVDGQNHRVYDATRISELTPEIALMCDNCRFRLIELHGEDINMNGRLDPSEDTNMNGILDPREDTNMNGMLDLGEDVDGDGALDRGIELIVEDRAVVNQMIEIYSLLSRQATALENFVETNSPRDANEFERIRTTVWPEIADLLGIEPGEF